MIQKEVIKHFYNDALQELTGNILPFWMNQAVDYEFGGFTGQINGHGQMVRGADKGGILNARILWTFSAAYLLLRNDRLLIMAERSKEYVIRHFFDPQGGTYWKLTFDGIPSDTKKQIYAQAFFLYALSEFYRATGDKHCLNMALSLFETIEQKSHDRNENGYFEAYSADWKLLDDLRLSDKDQNEKKTTNTHLHILEAYANLFDVYKAQAIESALGNCITLFADKIIDPETHHLRLFFDEYWTSQSQLVSYGHDIEASWLIDNAARKIPLPNAAKIKQQCIDLGIASLEGMQPDGSMIYEKDVSRGILDTDRHWWPQAETVVGLLNLYQLTGTEAYFNMALHTWKYITGHLIDHTHGEWYWSIKTDGAPNRLDDKAGFWKCPYHNARACMEIMKRCNCLLES
jgi:cellobiose epimerase